MALSLNHILVPTYRGSSLFSFIDAYLLLERCIIPPS